ncbi:unnamed protein product [Didymodactylos carnosus]|nr:unnamed protein product [Didymodactylos carnosus]CAF3666107.1 unnamed protein product [Didymodactylos carnosus]
MISNNENVESTDRSRFRVFNLITDRDGYPFTLNVHNIKSKFQTPSVVQVTRINMRSTVSVQSVSYTYQEFFHSYFRSYSFDIGITAGPVNAALSYHSTLSEVYQKITKDQAAVGMSTDWWGLFSITLAPVFILTYDPIFNLTISKLAANPLSETDQFFYNQLITSFGTHYISSVVVGGTVDMFTSVTSKFQQEYSKFAVSEQIGFKFSFEEAQMSASKRYDKVIDVSSETFRQNSQLEVKFLPAIIDTSAPKNISLDIWMNQTAKTPTVINRTMSSITNLLYDKDIRIRRYLQLTIDYYLKNGQVPSYEQLRNAGRKRRRRSLIGDSDMELIPGIDVIGCGYDIFSLDSKSCLFDLSTNDNETWIDVFNDRMEYQVPDGYFVRGTKDLLSMSDTAFFDTYKQFITESSFFTRRDSSGFLGFGASTNKQDTRTKYSRFYTHKYRMAWTKRQAIWFTLAVASFPTPKLNAITRLTIDHLPSTFDSNSTDNVQKWKFFFDSYGTHFVVRADIGGMFWGEDYFESCLIKKMTETWVRREIIKRYWFFSTRKIEETYDRNVSEEYQQNSLSIFKIIGGATDIIPLKTIEDWMPTIKDDPKPVTYTLQPIYTLLPLHTEKRTAMEEATFYFRSSMDNSANLYIQRLQSETSPPELPQMNCTEKKKKRSVK